MDFVVKKFNSLYVNDLYEILQIRSEIFVIEQNCIYQDIDNKDKKALHIIGRKNDKIAAYARVFDSGVLFDTPSISRLLVVKAERGHGYGNSLLNTAISAVYNNFKNKNISISAQFYLIEFYISHGFKTVGKQYLEDGLKHIKMIKQI
ncbi:MAG: GNAT family N-acetyltransferase [Tenacibaculum sp.]